MNRTTHLTMIPNQRLQILLQRERKQTPLLPQLHLLRQEVICLPCSRPSTRIQNRNQTAHLHRTHRHPHDPQSRPRASASKCKSNPPKFPVITKLPTTLTSFLPLLKDRVLSQQHPKPCPQISTDPAQPFSSRSARRLMMVDTPRKTTTTLLSTATIGALRPPTAPTAGLLRAQHTTNIPTTGNMTAHETKEAVGMISTGPGMCTTSTGRAPAQCIEGTSMVAHTQARAGGTQGRADRTGAHTALHTPAGQPLDRKRAKARTAA